MTTIARLCRENSIMPPKARPDWLRDFCHRGIGFPLFAKIDELIGLKTPAFGRICLIATLCYFLADHLISLLLIRFLHGAAFGCASTAMQTAVMDMIPHHRKGEGIGYFTLTPPSQPPSVHSRSLFPNTRTQ